MTRVPNGMPPHGGPMLAPGGDGPSRLIPPRLRLRTALWTVLGIALFALLAFGMAWLFLG